MRYLTWIPRACTPLCGGAGLHSSLWRGRAEGGESICEAPVKGGLASDEKVFLIVAEPFAHQSVMDDSAAVVPHCHRGKRKTVF